jgi:hypothetical protein
MKKRIIICLILLCGIIVFAYLCLFKNDTKAYMIELESFKEYTEYDITGDGKEDTLYIDTTHDQDLFDSINVTINNQQYELTADFTFYSYKVELISLKNNQKFIWVQAYSDNDYDPYECIYQYKDNKIEKVLNLNEYTQLYSAYTSSQIINVDKNTIQVEQGIMSSPLAYIKVQYNYEYKDDQWIRTNEISDILEGSYLNKSEYGTLKNNQTLYENIGDSQGQTINKGTQLKATRIYMDKQSIYVEVENDDLKGWIKCNQTFDDDSLLFEECEYAG